MQKRTNKHKKHFAYVDRGVEPLTFEYLTPAICGINTLSNKHLTNNLDKVTCEKCFRVINSKKYKKENSPTDL